MGGVRGRRFWHSMAFRAMRLHTLLPMGPTRRLDFPPRGRGQMSDPLAEVLAMEAEGLLFSAHDRAMAALAERPDDVALRYRATLTIARAGATGMALDLFHRLHLDAEADPEVAALGARLIKDRAFERPAAERGPLLAEAARRYQGLWQRSGEGWHGVNAAGLRLIAGEPGPAAEIA